MKDHAKLFADLNDLGRDSDLKDKDFVKDAFNILTGAVFLRTFGQKTFEDLTIHSFLRCFRNLCNARS